MKNYFPQGYCPQREKVLDLSRSVLSGGRRYARLRGRYGRYRTKTTRHEMRERLDQAAGWACVCDGNAEIDCRRCYSDDLPTVSETRDGGGPPKRLTKHTWSRWPEFAGFADDLGQLYRWFDSRTIGMDHVEMEEFLRAQLLASPFGHSVKTRHAFDHLFEEIAKFRRLAYLSDCRTHRRPIFIFITVVA